MKKKFRAPVLYRLSISTKYSCKRGVKHGRNGTLGVGENSIEHQLMSLMPIQEAKMLLLLFQLRPLPAAVETGRPSELPLLNSEA